MAYRVCPFLQQYQPEAYLCDFSWSSFPEVTVCSEIFIKFAAVTTFSLCITEADGYLYIYILCIELPNTVFKQKYFILIHYDI